jgi:glycosyltransferase involved in cell wall biosynthesis
VRILFVNEKCGYFGGVEQNVAVTAAGLRTMGHSCFLAYGEQTDKDVTSYAGLFEDAFECSEVSPARAHTLSRPFADVVSQVNPEAVYLHKVPYTAFCLPFVNKIRILRMVHDHDLCCPRRHKYYFHNEKVCHSRAGWRCYADLAFLARNSGSGRFALVSIQDKIREMRRNYGWNLLLVGSRFMRDELVQNGFSPTKVQILPPVVPWNTETDTPVPHEPVVLCVAQLIRGKGVDLLLEALKGLDCSFHAIIVGSGNAEHDLKNLCRDSGLRERVRFEGWVDNAQIGRFYEMARVVAFPSRWPEPFGMTGLEAMRHGRPVVGFDVGGVSDWLEHEVTGLLVAEGNVPAFRDALHRVLTDTDLAETLGRNARLQAEEDFSFDRYLVQLEHFLQGHVPAP